MPCKRKTTKHYKNVLAQARPCGQPIIGLDATVSGCPLLPAKRYSEIDAGFRPRTGASSRPGTGRDCSPASDRRILQGTQTDALDARVGLALTSTATGNG